MLGKSFFAEFQYSIAHVRIPFIIFFNPTKKWFFKIQTKNKLFFSRRKIPYQRKDELLPRFVPPRQHQGVERVSKVLTIGRQVDLIGFTSSDIFERKLVLISFFNFQCNFRLILKYCSIVAQQTIRNTLNMINNTMYYVPVKKLWLLKLI